MPSFRDRIFPPDFRLLHFFTDCTRTITAHDDWVKLNIAGYPLDSVAQFVANLATALAIGRPPAFVDLPGPSGRRWIGITARTRHDPDMSGGGVSTVCALRACERKPGGAGRSRRWRRDHAMATSKLATCTT